MKFSGTFFRSPPNDQGILIGAIITSLYTGIRSLTINCPLNVPTIGSVPTTFIPARLVTALVLGGFIGGNVGTRIGQCIESWRMRPGANPDIDEPQSWMKTYPNRTLLMRTLPYIFSILAAVSLDCYADYGGKPLFINSEELSKAENNIISLLWGIHIGGAIALRVGTLLDILTGKLVVDFGISKLLNKCRSTCKRTNSLEDQPENELTNPEAPSIPNTIVKRIQAAPFNDIGSSLGVIAGFFYMGIRSATVSLPLNVPLIGRVSNIPLVARIALASLSGVFTFGTFGNRYGQWVDSYRASIKKDEEPLNRTVSLWYLPLVFILLVVLITRFLKCYGGNQLFDDLELLPTVEFYLNRALYAAYIGGTVALRGGTVADMVTGKLIADFGLFRLKNKIQSSNTHQYSRLPSNGDELDYFDDETNVENAYDAGLIVSRN